MTEKEINSINRFLDGNSFNTKVRFWSVDESDLFELEYTFKIIGTKKMISVGEYYDFLKLDVEIIGADMITTQILSIYSRLSDDVKSSVERMLKGNYLTKVDIDKSIRELLKYFSNDYVHVVIENLSVSDSFIKKIKNFKETD